MDRTQLILNLLRDLAVRADLQAQHDHLLAGSGGSGGQLLRLAAGVGDALRQVRLEVRLQQKLGTTIGGTPSENGTLIQPR